MRPLLFLGALLTLSASVLLAQQQIKPEWKDVIATWQGTSTCAVPDSSCADEQALYRVKPDKKDPDKLTTEEFKMINNRPEFVGDLSCTYAGDEKVLTCYGAKHDVWRFQVSGNTMDGTLTVGKDKTVYRRISLTKM
jgi:hypothetical protein